MISEGESLLGKKTQLEEDIYELISKEAGIYSIKANGTVTNIDIIFISNEIKALPEGVMVELDLSPATRVTTVNGFNGCVNLTSVTFEDTSGWKQSDGTSITVDNPADNAKALTSPLFWGEISNHPWWKLW